MTRMLGRMLCVEQRDLAEAVAGSQGLPRRAVHGHHQPSRAHETEAVSALALPHDDLPDRNLLAHERTSKLFELRSGEHAEEIGGLPVATSRVRNSAALLPGR